jgi:hypothetical protein
MKELKNERIDVLALQATDSKGGLDRHKFAELIVRECFELVRFNSNGAGQEILEHFGVTE